MIDRRHGKATATASLDCDLCETTGVASPSSSPSSSSSPGFAFCCDEPACLPVEAAWCGPECPSTTFVGWMDDQATSTATAALLQRQDQVEDCAQCGTTDLATTKTMAEAQGAHTIPADPCCCDTASTAVAWPAVTSSLTALSMTNGVAHAASTCTEACFNLPGLVGSAGPSAALDDCPDCLPLPPIAPSRSSGQSVDCSDASSSAVATPIDGIGSITTSSKELNEMMKGLDDKTIQEILNCCCCVPELQQNPTGWNPLQHANHQLLQAHDGTTPNNSQPLQQETFFHNGVSQLASAPYLYSHHDSMNSANLLELHSRPPPVPTLPFPPLYSRSATPVSVAAIASPCHHTSHATLMSSFPCKWQDCGYAFDTREQLIMHVNMLHLSFSANSEPLQDLASIGSSVNNRSAMSSPWASPAPPLGLPTNDKEKLASATMTLVQHLLLEHITKNGMDENMAALLVASLGSNVGASGVPSQANSSHFPPSGTTTPIFEPSRPFESSMGPPSTTAHKHQAGSHRHSHAQQPQRHAHVHLHRHRKGSHAHHHHATAAHPYGVAATASATSATTAAHSHSTSASSTPGPSRASSVSGGYDSNHFHTVSSSMDDDARSTTTAEHACRWRGCSLVFESSAELMTHLSADHVGSGKAKYECCWVGCDRAPDEHGVGGRGFAQRQKVMRHLQTHTGDRPFACEICGKTFSEAMTLTQHMRVHTQEKPYVCTFDGCGKAFALASALTIHMRTHTGDKPFECPYEGCSASFAESSNLSKHVRTHRGDKSYVCSEPGCGRAFARSDQLARHGKIHTRQKLAAPRSNGVDKDEFETADGGEMDLS